MNTRSRFDQKLRGQACGVVVGAMALALAGTPTLAQTWIQLSPGGAPPEVRSHHSAVFDPGTNQMIVFAGIPPAGRENDVWRLSDANGVGAPTWTEVFPTGPIPATRWIHQAVYDEASNRMIVFGGGLGFSSPCTNETWVLSNANGTEPTPPAWTQLTPSGGLPAGRFAHSAVFDPITNRLIIHGGSNCFSLPSFNDVWVLSNANGLGGTPTWTQLFPTGAPVNSFVAADVTTYDAISNRMIVFGGFRSAAPSFGPGRATSNDVWVLTNANGVGGTPNWTQLIPLGIPPAPRLNLGGVYDANTNRLVIFGGDLQPGLVNDVWVLSNANGLDGTPSSWTELAPSGGPPSARQTHTAVYDPVTNRMVIFGGADVSGFLNDTWVLTNANGILTPEGQMEQLIDELQAIVDANPETELAEKVENGIKKLLEALEKLADEAPETGDALDNLADVVDKIGDAVDNIQDAIEDGLDPAQGDELMDNLAGIARQLAVQAIDLAVAESGDPDEIAQAQQALAEGDALRAVGAFENAVDAYGDAVEGAEGALP